MADGAGHDNTRRPTREELLTDALITMQELAEYCYDSYAEKAVNGGYKDAALMARIAEPVLL